MLSVIIVKLIGIRNIPTNIIAKSEIPIAATTANKEISNANITAIAAIPIGNHIGKDKTNNIINIRFVSLLR